MTVTTVDAPPPSTQTRKSVSSVSATQKALNSRSDDTVKVDWANQAHESVDELRELLRLLVIKERDIKRQLAIVLYEKSAVTGRLELAEQESDKLRVRTPVKIISKY